MNNHTNVDDHTNGDCTCTGEWLDIEARFWRAKKAMLQAQQQHCEATYEFLAARAELRQLLEAAFPEPNVTNLMQKAPNLARSRTLPASELKETTMTIHLDATLKAFQNGITGFGVANGIKNIDGWIGTLENAEFRGAKVIHENLSKLKSHLEADTLDGPAIGGLLHTLGEETKRAASHADGAQGEHLAQLAELLSKSHTDLGK